MEGSPALADGDQIDHLATQRRRDGGEQFGRKAAVAFFEIGNICRGDPDPIGQFFLAHASIGSKDHDLAADLLVDVFSCEFHGLLYLAKRVEPAMLSLTIC